FVQAEDCIRYPSVTGVQTCALPIYQPRSLDAMASQPVAEHRFRCALPQRVMGEFSGSAAPAQRVQHGQSLVRYRTTAEGEGGIRSEERRVGKECGKGVTACAGGTEA